MSRIERTQDPKGGEPLRVVHIGDSPDSSFGGISRVIRGHLGRSYRHVRTTARASFDPQAHGSLRKQFPVLRVLTALLRGGRIPPGSAILHVHMSKGFSLVREGAVALLGRLLGWRVVVTWHASTGLSASRLARRSLRLALLPAHLVTVLSESHAEVVPARRAHVAVIPNDVQVPAAVVPAGERARRVVFAGDVGPRKGADVLLEAWSGLPDQVRRTWCLDVYGRVLPELGDAVERARTDGSVRVHGPTDHRDVVAALSQAAVAVLPSRAEALPMFLLEAMASGCAVVGTSVGAVPALLANGAGLLVEPGEVRPLSEGLLRVIESVPLREQLAAVARDVAASRYSTERATELWEAVYERLVAG